MIIAFKCYSPRLGINCQSLNLRDVGLDCLEFDYIKNQDGSPTWVHRKIVCNLQYGKGNLAVNSRARCRTSATVSRFLMSMRTSLIMSAMAAISGSRIPRVVTAGVPRRMPLA